MDAATPRPNRLLNPVADLKRPETVAERFSYARGLSMLRWIGLVAGPPQADFDDLACQSLSADHPSDDPALWIA
jgi:hypothetical protein